MFWFNLAFCIVICFRHVWENVTFILHSCSKQVKTLTVCFFVFLCHCLVFHRLCLVLSCIFCVVLYCLAMSWTVLSFLVYSFCLVSSTRFASSRLVSSRLLVLPRLVSSRLVSSRLVSSRLVSSRLVLSCLVSSHLVSSRLISSRLVSFCFAFSSLALCVSFVCPRLRPSLCCGLYVYVSVVVCMLLPPVTRHSVCSVCSNPCLSMEGSFKSRLRSLAWFLVGSCLGFCCLVLCCRKS